MITPPLPETVGRYRIVRHLGSGAMGDVYLAEDPHIERRLAIKTLRLDVRDTVERRRRLLREAKAAGKLLHPHAVALFDAGEDDGQLFLAFEYVDGADLGDRLEADPPITLAQVLRLIREVASALDYAHRQGIVHRDIKPGNILVSSNGEAKVADFGIAKLVGQSTDLTRTGSVIGSPQYMSPEQVRGEPLDGRSDLFSLGVVFYELLTASRPFDGETISTLVFQILSHEPAPVADLHPECAPRLASLVSRMMAKDREERVSSAAEVMTEVAALEAELPPERLAAAATPPWSVQAAAFASAQSGTGTAPTRAIPPPPPPARTTPLPPPPPPSANSVTATGPTAVMPSAGRNHSKRHFLLGFALAAVLMVVGLAAGGWWVKQQAGRSKGEGSQVATPIAESARVIDTPAAELLNPASRVEEAFVVDSAGEARSSSDEVEDPPSAAREPTGAPTRGNALPLATEAPPPAPSPVPSPPPPVRPAASAPPPLIEASPPADRAAPGDTSTSRPEPSAGNDSPPVATRSEDAVDPRYERLARKARGRMSTGLSLAFDVEPKDALVSTWRRSEPRRIVHGEASQFAPGKRGSRTLELAFAGEYLIIVSRDGYQPYALRVDASESHSGTETVRVSLSSGAPGSSGPKVVGRWVAFSGTPADAVVFVDGKRQGLASEWPGGLRPGSNLRLAPGAHRLRIEAPGYLPHELRLETRPGGRLRSSVIEYRLEPQ